MKTKKSLVFGIFLFSLLMSMSLVLGANEAGVTSAPVTGANLTTGSSPTFNCSSSGSGLVYSILNATFYYNLSGTDTVIGTLTNTSATLNASISGTLSLASITKGLNYKISCKMCNASNCYSPTLNATSVDIYTSSPVCSYILDQETTEYMSPIGIMVSSQASSVDSLSGITYAWTLWDPTGNSQQTSTSATPTFSGSDFDEKGNFVLGLTVTDHWLNTASCTNKSIFVKGKDGSTTQVVTSQQESQTQSTTQWWWIMGVLIALGVIIVIAFFVISYSKKR